jgi:hypothetical protein
MENLVTACNTLENSIDLASCDTVKRPSFMRLRKERKLANCKKEIK